MRTGLTIVLSVVASGVLAATPDWLPLGENANGNRIYVDRTSIKSAADTTSVTFRTEL